MEHPTHKTRFSWDASTYDIYCERCGACDRYGDMRDLERPCPKREEKKDGNRPANQES